LRCEGLVSKAGRTISVVEGKAWQHDAGGPETLYATMTATMMTVLGRGLRH
jgi:acyl-coenzyme A thioesterase PaaI-like protein